MNVKKEIPGGSEVILVVEDEEPVRSLITRSLRKLGYYVLEAKQGEDALAVLQEYHGPAHLLITDLVMPELGGAPLIDLLFGSYPNLKVLIVSGFRCNVQEATGIACASEVSGNGFTFSADGFTLQYTDLPA